MLVQVSFECESFSTIYTLHDINPSMRNNNVIAHHFCLKNIQVFYCKSSAIFAASINIRLKLLNIFISRKKLIIIFHK